MKACKLKSDTDRKHAERAEHRRRACTYKDRPVQKGETFLERQERILRERMES
jgi:hypothetical protein